MYYEKQLSAICCKSLMKLLADTLEQRAGMDANIKKLESLKEVRERTEKRRDAICSQHISSLKSRYS